jgi:hypothetical protein
MGEEGRRMGSHEDRCEVPDSASMPSPVQEASRSLVPPVAAGLAAAVVGGVLWGLIVKWSDYEVGIIAWALGFVVGTAVVLATRGAKGPRLQVIAVICALAGILLGKYLSFAFVVQAEVEAVGQSIGLVSGDMVSFFRDELRVVFGLFDLLWVGLAVATAWRVPQREKPALAAPPG